MKLTIVELADKVNEHLENLSSTDKRFSNQLSPRRIRDYLSKGFLDKPFKDGKNIYFTEMHLQKLIALREVQSEGMSEENVKKFMSKEASFENDYIFKEENSLKDDAFNTINEIMNMSNLSNDFKKEKSKTFGYNATSSLNSLSASMGSVAEAVINSKENLAYISKPISKTWVEIPLTNSGKSFFRMEDKISFSSEEKKEILQNVKYILGIKGE